MIQGITTSLLPTDHIHVITTKIVSTTYFSFIVNDLQEYHIVVSTKLKSYKYDNR